MKFLLKVIIFTLISGLILNVWANLEERNLDKAKRDRRNIKILLHLN